MTSAGSSFERAKWHRESVWGMCHHDSVPDELADGYARHGSGKDAAISRGTTVSGSGRIPETTMRHRCGLKNLHPNPVPGA